MPKKTRHFGLSLPEYDDPLDIATSFNNAMDLLDNRIGVLTNQAWVTDTTFTVTNLPTSSKEVRTKRFNKTAIDHYRIVASGAATGTISIAVPTNRFAGEPEYQSEGNADAGPWDQVGSGIILDASTSLYYSAQIILSPSGADQLQIMSTTSTAANATNPITWASGDVIDFTIVRQTGETP